MPIQVSWGNPQKTVVLCVYSENWTLDEFHNMVDEAQNLIVSVDHTVHSISDFRSSKTSPAKVLSVGRHVENRSSDNNGISISVGANGFLTALGNVAKRLWLKDTELYFTDSLEEAYQIIAQHEQAGAKGRR